MIKIDTSKAEETLRRLGVDLREGINAGVANIAEEIEAGTKDIEAAHAIMSNLFNSISNFLAPGGKHWILRMSAKNERGHDYASDVYYGAKPHLIMPKTAKALNIPGIGYRKSAKHPGFKGRPGFEIVAGRINTQAAFDSGVNNFLRARGW